MAAVKSARCSRSLLLLVLLTSLSALAESGEDAWLRYVHIPPAEAKQYQALPSSLVVLDDSALLQSAQQELTRGVSSMLGKTLVRENGVISDSAIVLGTVDSMRAAIPELVIPQLHDDGFWLSSKKAGDKNPIIIAGATDRGVLYGAFAFLERIALGESVEYLNITENPYAPIRWIDQWDNLDGSIERGYAGPSIFFDSGSVRADLTRAGEYARLLASIGINGCTVNNVNADPRVLDDNFLPQLARIADVFRPWGVRLSIAVDFSSPKVIGGLDSFDPLD